MILGISFGPGFLRQAKGINENIVAPVTMCSLEDNTWVPEINEFAKVFGRPSFEVKVRDDGTIETVRVIRGSPCGSTVAASAELHGTQLSPGTTPALRPADLPLLPGPRFGKTCDKELSGLLHIRELVKAINGVSPAASERVKAVYRRYRENYRSENNRRITHMQDFLQLFADWLTYSILGLVQGTPLASSVNFFIYDSIKVTLMLAVIVFGVAIVRTYITPQKVKKWVGGRTKGWAMS